jgi:hypothetical protein
MALILRGPLFSNFSKKVHIYIRVKKNVVNGCIHPKFGRINLRIVGQPLRD